MVPFIAPMKTKFLKAAALKSKQRRGVAFLRLISFAITPSTAQVKVCEL
jgi:hypothetical protein